MILYYSPGACSMASHLALTEAKANFKTEKVDLKNKKYSGGDFLAVTTKGYVPALKTDSGEVLTEGAVILQYIADQNPTANLLPKFGTMERYKAMEWLNYIATEVHKCFSPLWSPATPDAVKASTKEALTKRFTYLANHLAKSDYLLGKTYSVADSYLFTVMGWTKHVGIDLAPWPALLGYMERIQNRPATHAVLKAEGLM